MERRVLIAITLSFLVLFLFQRFVMPPAATPESQSVALGGKPSDAPAAGSMAALTQASNQSAPTAVTATQPAAVNALAGNASPASPALPAPPALLVGETADREIVVDTTTVRATFSNRGARLLHWVLKDYRDVNGAPMDLVPSGAGPDAVKPFSLVVDDPAITTRINNGVYRVSAAGNVDATAAAQTITFEM